MKGFRICLAAVACAAVLLAVPAVSSQPPEFRAFWVDAFHNGFKNQQQVDKLLDDVRTANCNAIVCQLRRRGDTYYPSTLEPFASDANPAFDALAYLIDRAHSLEPRVEVHAWLCTLPVASSAVPGDPSHPINKYPGYLTRSYSGETFDGSNYCFDPGHPGALDYLTEVYLDVVRRYDVDGISFDYVRFAGIDWGYNELSVARYMAAHPTATDPPEPTDADWQQWRRDQVTALVRRVYANAIAINPDIVVSAATITWGDGPADVDAWPLSSAYGAVFQDWRAWMEEGILDLNIPMTYYRQYRPNHADYYDHWIRFIKDSRYGRHCAIGPAIYLNSIEDSFLQTRKTREATDAGNAADGVCFYSYAVTNDQMMDDDPVTGYDPTPDPVVPNAEFYSALSQASQYGTDPVFAEWVPTPDMPWKSAPTAGHIKGTITANGNWLDGASVSITGPENRTMTADGTGFYAFVDLDPGSYTVEVQCAAGSQSAQTEVSVGGMQTVDFSFTVPTPVISNVAAVPLDAHRLLITWQTDIAASSMVEYGPNRGLGFETAEDKVARTSHSVTLNSLPAMSPCYFRAVCNASSLAPSRSEVLCGVTGFDPDFIFDNIDGSALPNEEAWTRGTGANKYGPDYRFCSAAEGGDRSFVWNVILPYSGKYEVYVAFPKGNNRSSEAPFTLNYAGGSLTDTVNQKLDGLGFEANGNPDNVRLTPLGGVPVEAGNQTSVVLSNNTTAGGVVMADAVKFRLQVSELDPPTTPDGLQALEVLHSTAVLSWNDSLDASGVALYKVFRNGVLIGTTTSPLYVDNYLLPETAYDFAVSACDIFAAESEISDPLTVVTQPAPPPAPVVVDEGAYTANRKQLSAFWSPGNAATGAAGYCYALGTSPGASDICPWIETTQPFAVVPVAEQPYNSTAYFTVRARDANGVWSDPSVSDGITVARPLDSIAEARLLPDGEAVLFTSEKAASAAFDDFCYVQDADGAAGIRVQAPGQLEGWMAAVGGILGRMDGERALMAGEVIPFPRVADIRPFGTTCRSIGGSGTGLSPGPKAWRWVKVDEEKWERQFLEVPGINTGLLIRTWGRVSFVGDDYFYLDDGSGYDDTEAGDPPGVRVARMSAEVNLPAMGGIVSVEGVSATTQSDDSLLRVVLVRRSEDMRLLKGATPD